MRGIAEICGVSTPTMDKVLLWGQVIGFPFKSLRICPASSACYSKCLALMALRNVCSRCVGHRAQASGRPGISGRWKNPRQGRREERMPAALGHHNHRGADFGIERTCRASISPAAMLLSCSDVVGVPLFKNLRYIRLNYGNTGYPVDVSLSCLPATIPTTDDSVNAQLWAMIAPIRLIKFLQRPMCCL